MNRRQEIHSTEDHIATLPKPQAQGVKRCVREIAVATFLGMSVVTLRGWRSERSPAGPPVTGIDRIVLYSLKQLEQFMEQRTIEKR